MPLRAFIKVLANKKGLFWLSAKTSLIAFYIEGITLKVTFVTLEVT